MIISIALLGYGASGTFLALVRERLLPHVRPAFVALASLFGLSVPLAFGLAQSVPLNVLELAWDRGQQLHLLAVYLILAVPFFLAALAIGLLFAAFGDRIGSIYRSDLLGAGFGSVLIVACLFVLTPQDCLKAIAGLGLLAAACAAPRSGLPRAVPGALAAAAVGVAVLWPDGWVEPRPSPYKELSLALTVPNARIEAERSSPLGLLTVVASPVIPFRHAPGLSLYSLAEPPEQLGVFTDASGMTAITRFDGRRESIAYLDLQTAALPYHLLDRPTVLVLGAGGGSDVLLAWFHRSRAIDAVEINPQMVALVRRDFADFAGGVYSLPEVSVHVAEARSFAAEAGERYDLVQIALLDSFSAAAAGLHSLSESTLYTVEAFQTYLDRLAPGGYLAITRWFRTPPRDSLKIVATAVEALKARGIDEAGRRIAVIRGWRTATVLVKNGVLAEDDIAALRAFSEERGFDLAYHWGLQAGDTNRRNVLERPYLFEGTRAILGDDPEAFFRTYAFDVRPAPDDRPYFFHFLKRQTLVELLRLRHQGGLNLIEWGYPVLLATLAQALVASVVLILLPLLAFRRRAAAATRVRPGVRVRTGAYFFALGLAFLFVEMAFMQRMNVLLGHPLYAVSTTLVGFLVFAGLGSGCSRMWVERLGGAARGIAAAVGAVAAFALLSLIILADLHSALAGLALPVRSAVAVLLIAPLAFFMGMPFPIGLADTGRRATEMVPWSWGINGCASVLSAILATLLAVHFGFTVVLVLAVILYAVAAMVFPRGGNEAGSPEGRERPTERATL